MEPTLSDWRDEANQVMLCLCFDIKRANEVLEMDCLHESSSDGWLPAWCVSHVMWSPHINHRCVSPFGIRLLPCPHAELKYSCCREHEDSFGFYVPSLLQTHCKALRGLQVWSIWINFSFSHWRGLLAPNSCFSNWDSVDTQKRIRIRSQETSVLLQRM